MLLQILLDRPFLYLCKTINILILSNYCETKQLTTVRSPALFLLASQCTQKTKTKEPISNLKGNILREGAAVLRRRVSVIPSNDCLSLEYSLNFTESLLICKVDPWIRHFLESLCPSLI